MNYVNEQYAIFDWLQESHTSGNRHFWINHLGLT